MRCLQCGRELTKAQLIVIGTTFDCQICLSCNHLYVQIDTAQNKAKAKAFDKKQKQLPAPSLSGAPNSERCHLTPEEDAAARKLFES